jgi:preprotein translocase subunit SecG
VNLLLQLSRQLVDVCPVGLYWNYEMNQTFLYTTIGLIVISVAMVLIILVQRPQGGGLASAFGGGGGGNDTVFGGRVGDALTVMTVIAFVLFLGLAVALNLVESKSITPAVAPTTEVTAPATPDTVGVGLPATTATESKPDHPTGNSQSDHPTGGSK